MLEEAVSFFAEIKNLGISPNVVTFGTVVDALSKDGRMAEALGLFELMSQSEGLQPDTRTYNSLIYGYCHLRAWKEALKLFDEMWGRKMSPNSATFSIIFIALCKEGMVNKAHYLLEVMIQNKHFNEAMTLFHELETNGLMVDIVIYNIIIKYMCKYGYLKAAKKLFSSLSVKGLQPNSKTYSSMINGFVKKGLVNEAESLLIEMENNGSTPNEITLSVMIQGFLHKNDVHKALRLFNLIIERNFSPNAMTIS
ncbi:hypothetical protein Syun_028486 [Stephania yunnanensis]|uniref:Pentatricopeptide repeat-containing protein n=1 Tax=Stephania yunnanensis TaxID=152371 RepID=A0AAP0EK02_9MAGN